MGVSKKSINAKYLDIKFHFYKDHGLTKVGLQPQDI